MKVLVVLVFAVFTGYNANLVSADVPTPKLDELAETLRGYIQTARKTAEYALQRIMDTDIGNGNTVGTYLSEGLKAAWEGTPEWAKRAIGSAAMSVFSLSRQTEESLDAVGRKLEPLAEKLAEEVLEFAAPYTDKLKETMDSVAEQIQARVTQVYS